MTESQKIRRRSDGPIDTDHYVQKWRDRGSAAVLAIAAQVIAWPQTSPRTVSGRPHARRIPRRAPHAYEITESRRQS